MALILRVPFAVLTWLAFILFVSLPLIVVGVPVCAYLTLTDGWASRRSKQYEGRFIAAWRPRWAWLWSNEEDGIIGPPSWVSKHPQWSFRRLVFVWTALRNPVNNLRFTRVGGFKIDPKHVRFRGTPWRAHVPGEWNFCWCGWRSMFRWVAFRWRGKPVALMVGWRIYPEDELGVPKWDMRWPASGFALQFRD